MRARETGHWSAPDFGVGVIRERLLSMLDSFGMKPTAIVASAGAGKSFLAAQYARRSGVAGLWLDCDGVPPSAEAVWGLMAAGEARAGGIPQVARDAAALVLEKALSADLGGGVCLILDNMGCDADPEAFDGFRMLAQTLSRSRVRLLVTTRSLSGWSAAARCEWSVVDQQDLALRSGEALELARQFGISLPAHDIEDVREAAAGHVSLCAALGLQAARHGLDSSTRVMSLEAWLERALAWLDSEDLRLVGMAAALRHGTERDLRELGARDPGTSLVRVSQSVPLLLVTSGPGGELSFRVHDLLDGHFSTRHHRLPGGTSREVLDLLRIRGDSSRCCELLARRGDDATSRAWLVEHGGSAFDAGHVAALDVLFSRMDVSGLTSDARLLVLWARVCGQMGQHEESLAKARAARLLADHDRDWESLRGSVAQILSALQSLGRHAEANELAEEIASTNRAYVDDLLLAEALVCIGKIASAQGELRRAESSFHAVLEVCGGRQRTSAPVMYAMNGLALLHFLIRGDARQSREMLAHLAGQYPHLPSNRIILGGNLASLLMECGRMERAEALAGNVVSEAERYGLRPYVGTYSHVLGQAKFARGDTAGGLAQMRLGIATSVETDDLAQVAVDRIWVSQALRASGHTGESLTQIEMSYECLSRRDELGFRHLAGYEVAASLLACGDRQAARGWIVAVGEPAKCENLYYRTAATLTLAECDRGEGHADKALLLLSPLADYLCSESPNRLLSLYARAFPNLLGLVALTVGVENLPVHMLRLIPPESAEIILGETRSWLDDAVWRALGLRLLGEDEFERFLSRDGLPVCHVRFFGALEVTIGGRSIREKDWRKRKARLLFAMLVSRRGYDVPREQIFEHLFADMDPERAKNNLYVSWSTMKSVLLGAGAKGADLPYLEAIGGVCRAVSANIRSDIDDFDKLLASASQHEAAGEYPAALLDYEALSSLYRGELLPGDVYDDWFAELREHYRITFVDAMLSACSLLMDADDPGNALVFARRAIQTDPLREDLYQAALRCQIAAGQRSGAIDTYVQCRSKLADDLGLDPSVETKALYDQILAMEDRPRLVPLDPFVD